MSTAPAPAVATKSPDEVEIRIISHSSLFYWWPVWAVALILGLLTYVDRYHMAIVPPETEVLPQASVTESKDGKTTTMKDRTVIVLPEKLPDSFKKSVSEKPSELIKLHTAHSKSYGVIFVFVLLLV